MIEILNWGRIPYSEAVTRQMALVDEIVQSRQKNISNLVYKIILCTHPPVVTLGRGTKPGDVYGWQGEMYEASRGGRATYHGPSQIVAYPIVDLMGGDLHGYMRALEEALVATLKEFNIESEVRKASASDQPSLTGVWVGEKKIASIGIGVKRGVAYHGLALNVSHDPTAYSGIKPCGFSSEIMTSVEEVLQKTQTQLNRENIQICLQEELTTKLKRYLCDQR